MGFRSASGCGWGQEQVEGGAVVGEEGRGRTWVVQGGEMTAPLIAEAPAIGRIMLGSS
jgi:hypothetical protein